MAHAFVHVLAAQVPGGGAAKTGAAPQSKRCELDRSRSRAGHHTCIVLAAQVSNRRVQLAHVHAERLVPRLVEHLNLRLVRVAGLAAVGDVAAEVHEEQYIAALERPDRVVGVRRTQQRRIFDGSLASIRTWKEAYLA